MNPFDFLFLPETATREEVEAAYARLRAQYAEDRFLDGDAGRQGAVNLTNLDAAYQEIIRRMDAARNSGTGSLGEVDELLKAGRLDEAQFALDAIPERGGEWHFLQSVLYYKRGWFMDSRTQLQAAINLDPTNSKYTDALTRLDNFISGAAKVRDPYQSAQQPSAQPDAAMGVSNCCTTLCLMNCCCELMRCC